VWQAPFMALVGDMSFTVGARRFACRGRRRGFVSNRAAPPTDTKQQHKTEGATQNKRKLDTIAAALQPSVRAATDEDCQASRARGSERRG
jgi:hypothetical protein